jgi:hypothetical protein
MSIDHNAMIAVIAAHRDGEEIQRRISPDDFWTTMNPESFVRFDFQSQEYRIKPQPPKPREWFIYLWNGVEATCACQEGDSRLPILRSLKDGQVVHVREVLP